MKVVFCTGYYQEYLNYFYKKNPSLISAPYATQMEALLDDCFVNWGGYVRNFKKYDDNSCLIIPNCRPLQAAWAKENNTVFDEKDWQFAIPIQQVKAIRPDILYMGSMFDYYEKFLDKVRNYTSNVFGWISCRIPEGTKYHKLDLILTSLPSLANRFKSEGVHAEYLNSSFDDEVLKKLRPIHQPDIDFSFVGSITGDHKNRIDLINELLLKTSIQIFGRNSKSLDKRNFIDRLFSKSAYTDRINSEVYGIDMYKVLQRSKITFNKHIDMSREYVGNARMFEATGAGTLLLTDGLNAPNKVFKDDEVVYYETAEQAIEQLNFYLNNEEERLKIAKRGQQRTLTDYNCELTAKKMQDLFTRYIK